ncbi:MAG: homocysteine S-methyltransferase family protein [Holophaga sp.]|nr:homocysteine S-methyltransferase family protein [Holophaga sp.]
MSLSEYQKASGSSDKKVPVNRRQNLANLLSDGGPVLMEGGVVERVRRGAPDLLDPLLMNAPLIYSEAGRALLHQVFVEYMAIGRMHDLPLLSLAPTWRANSDRLAASAFAKRDLNGDAVRFLQTIRDEFGEYGSKIYIGGLMGCRGDAYKPQEALPRAAAQAFHLIQARALVEAGADYLMASTMPEIHEALGMAEALASTGCPYLVSFIVRPSGCLLDGTPLDEAMLRADDEVSSRPLGYLVNCIHSSALDAALGTPLGQRALATGRLLGLQANTSPKSPEELDGSDELEGEAPELFAADMCTLRNRFGLRVLGGCCGTDARHIAALAKGLIKEQLRLDHE